jgi:hypothetical protein
MKPHPELPSIDIPDRRTICHVIGRTELVKKAESTSHPPDPDVERRVMEARLREEEAFWNLVGRRIK